MANWRRILTTTDLGQSLKTIDIVTDSGFTWGSSDVVLQSYEDTLQVVAGTGIQIQSDASNTALKITNTISDSNLTTEEVQDIIGAMVDGNTETNIAVTYDDTNGKLDFVSTDTNTQLSTEEVEDIVGAMFTGNTETFITATYQDGTNDLDLVVPVKDEDDLASNSDTHLATQQSIKAYVDAINSDNIFTSDLTQSATRSHTLKDNEGSAITFGCTGKADLFKIDTTDSAEKVSTSGEFAASGMGGFGSVKTPQLKNTTNGGIELRTYNGSIAIENALDTPNIDVGGGYGSTGCTIAADGNLSTNGNVIIDGNLTVSGTTTTLDVTNLVVEDKIIRVAHLDTATTTSGDNSGLEVLSNTTVNPTIKWRGDLTGYDDIGSSRRTGWAFQNEGSSDNFKEMAAVHYSTSAPGTNDAGAGVGTFWFKVPANGVGVTTTELWIRMGDDSTPTP